MDNETREKLREIVESVAGEWLEEGHDVRDVGALAQWVVAELAVNSLLEAREDGHNQRCSHCGLLKAAECFTVHNTMCDDCWDNRKDVEPEREAVEALEGVCDLLQSIDMPTPGYVLRALESLRTSGEAS